MNQYIYTKTRGKVDECQPDDAPCPSKWKRVAAWHTHGAFTDSDGDGRDDYDSENFSGAGGDVDYAEAHGQPLYLATPGGDFRKYDPATNRDIDLGSSKTKSPWSWLY